MNYMKIKRKIDQTGTVVKGKGGNEGEKESVYPAVTLVIVPHKTGRKSRLSRLPRSLSLTELQSLRGGINLSGILRDPVVQVLSTPTSSFELYYLLWGYAPHTCAPFLAAQEKGERRAPVIIFIRPVSRLFAKLYKLPPPLCFANRSSGGQTV